MPLKTRWFAILLVVQIGTLQAHPGKIDREGCHRDTQRDTRHCHPARAQTPPPRRGSLPAPQIGEEGVFDGRVVWVTDGDSLRVLVKGREMEIRLADVDAPEREQPHGWRSKLQLIDLVRDRHAVVVPRDVDQYGRVVARVWVDDVDINRELVKRGAAWFYPAYAEDEALYYDEQNARASRLGLWALMAAERIEPWEWRRRKRQPTGNAVKPDERR